jgi:hypothetical protein
LSVALVGAGSVLLGGEPLPWLNQSWLTLDRRGFPPHRSDVWMRKTPCERTAKRGPRTR